MKKIKLNEIEYNVPESWDEITLGHQIQVSKYNDEFNTDVMKRIGILSAYSGIPVSVLKRTNINDLQEMFKLISFINKDIPTKPIDKFEFKGETYYVAQNLMEQEFQDYVSLQVVLQTFKDNQYLALPHILAIMSKRIKEDGSLETLDDYDVDKRAEEFKGINISVSTSISVFFSQSINAYSTISQLYSNPKELVEMKIDDTLNTLKPQVGQGLFTRCVAGILRNYLKSIKRKLPKHFTSSQ